MLMKCTRLLNYINNYFEKLSTFQKIEMYLIPIILALLLVYNFPKFHNKVISNINNVDQDVYEYEIKKRKIINKMSNVSNIEVVKNLQKKAIELNLNVSMLKVVKKYISIEVRGDLKEILHFVDFSENYKNYTIIKNLVLTSDNKSNQISAFLNISFSEVLRTEKREKLDDEIEKINNPLLQKVFKPLPKLHAIVNDYVLINNSWLRQNEVFDGYKVKKIYLDFVELESDSNVFTIRLFSED